MRIDELARKLEEHLLRSPGATHIGLEKGEVERLVSFLCHDPHMIDTLGEMTERCFKAEGQLAHCQETTQERFEERNGAREMARLFWPAYQAANPEEAAFWDQHCPWINEHRD